VRMAKRIHDRASGTSCKATVVAFLCYPPVPSCYRQPNRATRAAPCLRAFLVCVPPLTGNEKTPGCNRPPVFLLLFTGKYRAAGVAFARCRKRRGSLPLGSVGGAPGTGFD